MCTFDSKVKLIKDSNSNLEFKIKRRQNGKKKRKRKNRKMPLWAKFSGVGPPVLPCAAQLLPCADTWGPPGSHSLSSARFLFRSMIGGPAPSSTVTRLRALPRCGRLSVPRARGISSWTTSPTRAGVPWRPGASPLLAWRSTSRPYRSGHRDPPPCFPTEPYRNRSTIVATKVPVSGWVYRSDRCTARIG